METPVGSQPIVSPATAPAGGGDTMRSDPDGGLFCYGQARFR